MRRCSAEPPTKGPHYVKVAFDGAATRRQSVSRVITITTS